MNERLTDLLAELRERLTAGAGPDEVEAYLSSAGYDRHQIGEILTLLFAERGERSGDSLAGAQAGFRVLGPHEQGRFAPDAWGHLLTLTGSGVLSAVELEHVIERALAHVEGRIALDDLRSLMESSGYEDAGASADHPTVH